MGAAVTEPLKTVRELCARLKPLMGARADALLNAWIAEDFEGRREIQQLLELEHQRQFADVSLCNLAPPDKQTMSAEGIEVGSVCHLDKKLYPFRLPDSQLNRHVLIAGASGCGKTTLIYQIAKGLLERKLPFFLFDFKLDYRPLVRVDPSLRVFTVGEEVAPFQFNPLVELILLCEAKSGLRDLSPLFQLSDVLCKTFYAGHGVKSILNAAFAHAAHHWKDNGFAASDAPSFRSALSWVREHEPADMKGLRFREWKVSTIRALEQLCTGSFGTALAVARDKHSDIGELKRESVIFELNLPEDLKRFFVEMLLLCMRQQSHQEVKQSERGVLRNVMIIDESHNLLKQTEEKIESQLSLALREHRGMGTAYVIADQTPSQLDESAIANTFTKFFFQLDNRADIRTASQSLLLSRDDEDWLGKLPVGRCLARFGTHNAFVVQVDHVDEVKNQPVSDEEIAKNARDSSHSAVEQPTPVEPSPNQAPKVSGTISDEERKLLVHILKEPFAGVSRHFKAVSMSTRKGHEAKTRLEARGFIKSHEVHKEIPGGGMTVILEITEHGAEFLRELGHDARYPYYRASPEHEYWKEQAAQHLARQGYAVTKELPLPLGGSIDVAAVKDGRRVAVEVETGKSDPVGNIWKAVDAGFEEVVSLSTNSATAEATERALRASSPSINSSYPPRRTPPNDHADPINSSYPGRNAVKRDRMASIDASYSIENHNAVKVQTVAALQPTAEEFVNRFFSLAGAEKLLVLDVLDFPASPMNAREERVARAGVPPERIKDVLTSVTDGGLLRNNGESLELAPTTRDAFKTLRILRD